MNVVSCPDHTSADLRGVVWAYNAFTVAECMAAVSVMRMRTGSYAHIIATINFGGLKFSKKTKARSKKHKKILGRESKLLIVEFTQTSVQR